MDDLSFVQHAAFIIIVNDWFVKGFFLKLSFLVGILDLMANKCNTVIFVPDFRKGVSQ